uniref:Uncharacterized protein n=1 Tax=Geospiza parvula TaxID=87175 RepID=A0A8C3MID7_GEOPR
MSHSISQPRELNPELLRILNRCMLGTAAVWAERPCCLMSHKHIFILLSNPLCSHELQDTWGLSRCHPEMCWRGKPWKAFLMPTPTPTTPSPGERPCTRAAQGLGSAKRHPVSPGTTATARRAAGPTAAAATAPAAAPPRCAAPTAPPPAPARARAPAPAPARAPTPAPSPAPVPAPARGRPRQPPPSRPH